MAAAEAGISAANSSANASDSIVRRHCVIAYLSSGRTMSMRRCLNSHGSSGALAPGRVSRRQISAAIARRTPNDGNTARARLRPCRWRILYRRSKPAGSSEIPRQLLYARWRRYLVDDRQWYCSSWCAGRQGYVQGSLGGFDPRTGKGSGAGCRRAPSRGWDITFSTPKSFGILWAAGTAEQRAVLERIQNDAVDQALQFIIDEGLVEVRLGAGGRVREAPAEILVAKFPHFTSREGDPACHVHSVLISAARAVNHGSADAKYYCLEPKRLYEWQLVLGAAFRTALSERLVKAGFALRPAGKDQVEIEAIPEAMIESFSKRARQIRAFARPDASAAKKEVAALATRRGQGQCADRRRTGDALEKELAAFEIDPWKVVLEAGKKPTSTADNRDRLRPRPTGDCRRYQRCVGSLDNPADRKCSDA